MQQELQTFGDLQCLVVGQFVEVSKDLHDLLCRWATSGQPVREEPCGQFLHQLCRELSAVRAQACCLLSCLGHMGPGGKASCWKAMPSKTASWACQARCSCPPLGGQSERQEAAECGLSQNVVLIIELLRLLESGDPPALLPQQTTVFFLMLNPEFTHCVPSWFTFVMQKLSSE